MNTATMISQARSAWKRAFVFVFWIVLALNAAYFVRRTVFSEHCDVETIAEQYLLSKQASADDGGCTFARNASTPSRHPPETNWCMYDDEVSLRIIIMTFNRRNSLLRLLSSLNDLEMDGDSVAVEIWIDRDIGNGVDKQTLLAAHSFRWRHGRVRVHVHRRHVGIYGQWMATWRPRSNSTSEMALLLEDDLTVSPYAYRWLRAARQFYADRRDLAGFTLQSEGLIKATTGRSFTPPSADTKAAYLYALMGSWGFAPRPEVWIGFQNWYALVTAGRLMNLRPIVPGIIMSKWYIDFEREHKANTMWTMWFIYYCSRMRAQLYTVFNNVHSIAAAVAPTSTDRYLAINRREAGLHFANGQIVSIRNLLRVWRPQYAKFSRTPPMFNFSGERIDSARAALLR